MFMWMVFAKSVLSYGKFIFAINCTPSALKKSFKGEKNFPIVFKILFPKRLEGSINRKKLWKKKI